MRLPFVWLSCLVVTLAAKKSYDGYKVYSVQLRNAEQMNAFMSLRDYDIDSWDSPNQINQPFRVMVGPSTINVFETVLGRHDIFADIIIDDVQRWVKSTKLFSYLSEWKIRLTTTILISALPRGNFDATKKSSAEGKYLDGVPSALTTTSGSMK